MKMAAEMAATTRGSIGIFTNNPSLEDACNS